MHRIMLAAVLLFLPAVALAQFNPYAPPVPGITILRPPSAEGKGGCLCRRSSRGFVETHGEPAVAAIFACSQAAARKLVEFSNSGGLARLPRPADLLRVIAQRGHGDDVLLYAIRHANELTDVDHFNAYLSPLEYVSRCVPLRKGPPKPVPVVSTSVRAELRRVMLEPRTYRPLAQATAAPWQVTLDGQAWSWSAASWPLCYCCSGGNATAR